MWREKGETEGEVGGGEYGEGLDEDVGNGFVARQVRIELIASICDKSLASPLSLKSNFDVKHRKKGWPFR